MPELIFKQGSLQLVKTKRVEEVCCVDGCDKEADVAFFTSIRQKKGTDLVCTLMGIEVCLPHYQEHFSHHLAYPRTDRGWDGLKGES